MSGSKLQQVSVLAGQLTVGCKYRQPTVGVSTVPNYHNRVHVARMVVLMAALMLTAPDEHTTRLSLHSLVSLLPVNYTKYALL